MYSILKRSIGYLKFYWSAKSARGHGMHSPFVYRFINDVLADHTYYPDYGRWSHWRKALLKDTTPLPFIEMGAGSVSGSNAARKVSDLARKVTKPMRTGRLLYRIARYYEPGTLLELGTSLGLSTAWLAMARPHATLYTIEGVPSVADRARQHIEQWQLSAVQLVEGNFEDRLPPLLAQLETVDLVFMDGNHRREPTLRYFEWLLHKKNANSVFILDDIHWSAEMEEAWRTIQQHPEVRCTIDLYQIGLVFFRPEFRTPRHFSIRF